MLPDASGWTCARTLRGRSRVPIILLTALKEDVDRIIALRSAPTTIWQAVQSAGTGGPDPRRPAPGDRTRRAGGRSGAVFRFAGFTADNGTRRVTTETGEDVAFTSAEFDLLMAFWNGRAASCPRSVARHHQGREAGPFDRSIDVLVSRVRRKLGDAGSFQI